MLENYVIENGILVENLEWTAEERLAIAKRMEGKPFSWHFFKYKAGNAICYQAETTTGGKAFHAFTIGELLIEVSRFLSMAKRMQEHADLMQERVDAHATEEPTFRYEQTLWEGLPRD